MRNEWNKPALLDEQLQTMEKLGRVSDYLAAQFFAAMPAEAADSHFEARWIIHRASNELMSDVEASMEVAG